MSNMGYRNGMIVMFIDLTQYKVFCKNLISISEQFMYKILTLENIIDINNVEIVYPKGMFIGKSSDLNLILFTKNNIYSVVLYPNIRISVLRKNDIKKINLNLCGTSSDPDYELIITFDHGEEIRLFNVDDTDEDWKYHFAEYVLKIYKYLLIYHLE